jgi:translocation and assembly module TamB
VNLREIPPSASVRSSDVIIVGRRAAPRPTGVLVKDAPLDIQPNVSITLGDKVKFNGFGLDARLEGKLRVLRTRQDIVAEGVLSVVDGVYKAYGQNLAIERGRLLFNGALDNPGLDVRAVREVDGGDIKVGMTLAGTVRKPESTLFSSPQQTQSDTLSYLLTGRAMSGLSGDQSSLLVDAVTQTSVTLRQVALPEFMGITIGYGLGVQNLLQDMARAHRQQWELAVSRVAKDAQARCAEWLLSHAETSEKGACSVMFLQRKRMIAAQLGIAPETLSRALRHLRERRLISGSGRVVNLVDPTGLRSLAGA